jgi:PAS domain S-box-containing protein
MSRLARAAVRALRSTHASIARIESDQVLFEGVFGPSMNEMIRSSGPSEHSYCRFVLLSGEPLAINDTSEQALVVGLRDAVDVAPGERAYLGVPMRAADGRVYAVLSVTDSGPRQWLPADVELLGELAGLVSTASVGEPVPGMVAAAFDQGTSGSVADRLALQALQQQAMLVHLVHDPIYVWHPTRGIVFWNLGCEQLYGYSRDEAAGRVNHQLLSIRFPGEFAAYQEALLRDGRWTGELSITTKHRRRVIVSSRVQRISAAGETLFLQADRDITALRRTMERLAVSESRYQNLLMIAPVGVFETDVSGNYMYVNERWVEIACIASEQAVGHGWLDAIDSRDRERVRQAWHESVRRQTRFAEEFRFNCSGSGVNWVLSQSIPLIGTDGRFSGFIGAITDITANKRVELDLRRSREQLRNFVGHLDSAIEEERRRIAREVHDQLGQALTAMKLDVTWSVQQMAGEAVAGQDPVVRKLRDLLEIIDSTVDTVQRISGELRPQLLESMGLGPAVEVLAEQFHERTGIRCVVDTDTDAGLPLRSKDGMQVYRIIQESLTNVMRHAGATRVDIRIVAEDGTLSVSIQDNGRGIAESEQDSPHAFGMIGMRERARLLGGNLTVSGAPRMGTTVQLEFPLRSEFRKE